MHLKTEYFPFSTFNADRNSNDTTFNIKLHHKGPIKEYFVRTHSPMKSSIRAYLEPCLLKRLKINIKHGVKVKLVLRNM